MRPEEWEFWHAWTNAQRLLAGELERALQRDFGISKAEFSVLVTLHQAPEGRLRVGALAESLSWEKSRVAHLLTRMEKRDLVERAVAESSGRRTGIALTAQGRAVAEDAIEGHGVTIRRTFFDPLTPEQAVAFEQWSRQIADRLGPDPA